MVYDNFVPKNSSLMAGSVSYFSFGTMKVKSPALVVSNLSKIYFCITLTPDCALINIFPVSKQPAGAPTGAAT